jgi:hypothetical protein
MAQLRGPIRCQKKYMIDELEHIRELPEASVERFGLMLSEGLTNGVPSWRKAACELAISNDDILAIGLKPNPGYETLKEWRNKPNSTIKALRQVMDNVGRSDVIAVIDEFQKDQVQLTISLFQEGVEIHDLSGKCPSRMPIIEYVRPLITRKMAPELVSKRRDQRIIIQMRRPDVTWASPAKKFQAQHLMLEKVVLGERKYTERKRRRELKSGPVCPERFVVSEMNDVWIHFEIVSEDDSDTDRESPVEENPPPIPVQEQGGSDSCGDVIVDAVTSHLYLEDMTD